MTLFREMDDTFIRPLNLTWRLDNRSRRRLVLVCALPAIIIFAQAISALLAYSYSPNELVSDQFVGAPSEFWQRLYRAARTVQILAPAAVAILFFGGLRRWSPAEGSWMFAAGAALASVAIIAGTVLTFVLTASSDEELPFDLRVQLVWEELVPTFGLLAVGFFFVAYRGLSAAPQEAPAPIADS